MKNLKVAIFYDWLNQWGGAEKVFLDLMKIYPKATIFTLVHNPNKTKWLPKNTKIITSFINKLPFSKKNSIFYAPFYTFAIEQFDFSDFDVVISTTSTIGHGLLTNPKTLFICYMHNINRYLYQTPKKYLCLTPLLKLYQKIDLIYSKRPDYIFCNSKTVQKRILDRYHQSAKVIYPGIDIGFFHPKKEGHSSSYFLVVSRLVAHKKVDLVIKACHKLNLNLKIVGDGRERTKLNKLVKKLNNPNIEMLGQVDQYKLLDLYQNCTALICPQEEDFGLTPLEAQSCGKPVIAFKKGGILETVIGQQTGVFFDEQTTDSLTEVLKCFSSNLIDPIKCLQNSKKFSNKTFMLNFKQAINDLWIKHQKTTTF